MLTDGELFNARQDHENGSVVASSSVGAISSLKWTRSDHRFSVSLRRILAPSQLTLKDNYVTDDTVTQ